MTHLHSAALKTFKTFNNQIPGPWIDERDISQNCQTYKDLLMQKSIKETLGAGMKLLEA